MIIYVDVVGVFLHYSRHRQPVGPNVPLLSCPIRSFFRGPRSTASTVNTSIIPRSNLFLWVFEAFRLIIPVDTEQTNYHFKHRKQAKSAAVTSKTTCVILGAIQDHKDVSVCSSVLLVTSFYPHCVCRWHGCRKKLPHLIISVLCFSEKLRKSSISDIGQTILSSYAVTLLSPFCSKPRVASESSSSSSSPFFMNASSTGTSSLASCLSSSSTASHRLQGKKYLKYIWQDT